MRVSIEDFKTQPVITGDLNLKWELRKLFPGMNFTKFVDHLSYSYQQKYSRKLEAFQKERKDFVEASIWHYMPQYKIKLDHKGLTVFLVYTFAESHGYLFRVDCKKREIELLN